jgi:hypothetical protein
MKFIGLLFVSLAFVSPAQAASFDSAVTCLSAMDFGRDGNHGGFAAVTARVGEGWNEWAVSKTGAISMKINFNGQDHADTYFQVPGQTEMIDDTFVTENARLRLTSSTFSPKNPPTVTPTEPASLDDVISAAGKALDASAPDLRDERFKDLEELNGYLKNPSEDGPEGKPVSVIFEERREDVATTMAALKSCDGFKNARLSAATKAYRAHLAKVSAVLAKLK